MYDWLTSDKRVIAALTTYIPFALVILAIALSSWKLWSNRRNQKRQFETRKSMLLQQLDNSKRNYDKAVAVYEAASKESQDGLVPKYDMAKELSTVIAFDSTIDKTVFTIEHAVYSRKNALLIRESRVVDNLYVESVLAVKKAERLTK
jgi:type II secretory pathway pseudopilin PulG